jgi:hypothetical protein
MKFIFVLVAVGFLQGQGFVTEDIDYYLTEEECKVAQVDFDSTQPNPAVQAIGTACVKVTEIKR